MTDTLLRHLAMLRLIPRSPRKVDAGTLQRQLAGTGFTVTQRTIRRDLDKLSANLPLVCDDRNKPHGWSWMENADALTLPALDPQAALSFKLMELYLTPLLPSATLN